MMKIAYLHYHLKTGGVTTVIKQQAEALKHDCDILVLSGTHPESEFPFDVHVVKGAGYTIENEKIEEPASVAERIISAINSRWPEGCDILHIHNPVLAKNSSFLVMIKILQERGVRLFLHIHDFAEDGRPGAYFKEDYPADCHYGVINSRDHRILLESGLHEDGVHNLFNMVKPFDYETQNRKQGNYFLYPVRAIRRKNIGEAILISLFLKNREKLMVTLPPNSEQDVRSHEGWKRFVSDHSLNVELEASLHHDFMDLVYNAAFIFTSSITEGFGFSFSEPWTAGKQLWGRKIPDICADFEKTGVLYPNFYTNLFVPLEWVGENAFFKKWESCIRKNLPLYQLNDNDTDINALFQRLISNGCIDFGVLDEHFQKKVLRRIIRSSDAVKEMIINNPFLQDLNPSLNEPVIFGNNEAIRKHYSMEKYRCALLTTYDKIIKTNVNHTINKNKLISAFISTQKLSLLKWGPYDESSDYR